MKKILFTLIAILLGNVSFAETWVNDMRSLYLNNQAIIMTVNMRTFSAQDINGNGIIEVNKGEQKGNFVNAVDRLDEISQLGINTLHLLPITPVGKRKAFGTAGSLFAAAEFDSI